MLKLLKHRGVYRKRKRPHLRCFNTMMLHPAVIYMLRK
nr:MAG TPA: hypothetical protein [Caudoviricetes sp.]